MIADPWTTAVQPQLDLECDPCDGTRHGSASDVSKHFRQEPPAAHPIDGQSGGSSLSEDSKAAVLAATHAVNRVSLPVTSFVLPAATP